MIGFEPMMWVVWVVCVLLLAAVSLYSSHLAKDEEDQLFLDDSSSHVKAEQDAILAKVSKIAPLKYGALALAGAVTLFVAGYYILNMIQQFR